MNQENELEIFETKSDQFHSSQIDYYIQLIQEAFKKNWTVSALWKVSNPLLSNGDRFGMECLINPYKKQGKITLEFINRREFYVNRYKIDYSNILDYAIDEDNKSLEILFFE